MDDLSYLACWQYQIFFTWGIVGILVYPILFLLYLPLWEVPWHDWNIVDWDFKP